MQLPSFQVIAGAIVLTFLGSLYGISHNFLFFHSESASCKDKKLNRCINTSQIIRTQVIWFLVFLALLYFVPWSSILPGGGGDS